MMKKTLAVIYNGGAYGTYLEWVLNMLASDQQIQSPFTAIGNSHLSTVGKQFHNMEQWRNYVRSDLDYPTIRIHPKTIENEILSENLDEILKNCLHAVLIYPDRDHELLAINNFMTKVYPTHELYQGPLKDVNLDEIYKNFPVSPEEEIPRWIIREHLSYYLVPAWRAQVDWFLPDTWQHHRCMIIYINELLHEFESCIQRIKDFWGVRFSKTIQELQPFHREMLSLQSNLGQDKLCRNIIEHTLYRTDLLEWSSLPLASESWIQWRLRDLGYELKCHDLDDFPLDSQKLRSIIYEA